MTFHLFYWGQVENDNWIERDLEIKDRDFFFPAAIERKRFRAQLEAVAAQHSCTIVFSEHDGPTASLRTIASMRFVLPCGDKVRYLYDFGYGYPPAGACYMFEERNYACDCNRSLFLSRIGCPIEELDCGDIIRMEDFKITQEAA